MDSLHDMPAKAPSSAQALNIGVVGLGRMGKRHAKTLLYRVPTANLVAVCTNDKKELAWARPFFAEAKIAVYDNYDDMISHKGLQAVWVSTSTNTHASMSIAAMEKDLHVLCEKPLSFKLDEVRNRLLRF